MAEERLGPASPHGVTERLRALVAARTTREIDPRELAARGSDQLEELTAELEALAREGVVTAVTKWTCPERGCGLPLSGDDVQAGLSCFIERYGALELVGHSGDQNGFISHLYMHRPSASGYIVSFNTDVTSKRDPTRTTRATTSAVP